ncbi:response regulator [Pseudosulfitobacter sp. DSM 107133]|uniref:response regulator n=1 Tax=Pseudosulfitobacter sp. DSM 107133 TaxID=2883100 RepID=UPI000DF47782|nr:response regulator [Pseudosulfitobacter sp. DSM 107133]UOA29067.1 Chemotaxis protein CheY [Pseudosulfitobacter sp. DSM 107133]
MRILAVDDDPIILELLTQFVAAIGEHELTTAESGPEALEVLKRPGAAPFDCFMLDIQMPQMDGIELMTRIRDMARYADTPVLMVTAMSEKRYIDAAFKAGATDYVTKPFEVNELRARVGMVEKLAATRQSRTKKIFAAKTVAAIPQTLELHEPLSVYDVDNVIDFIAMENYVAQLTRNALFGSTAFGFSIRNIEGFHAALNAFEFNSLITDVAEVISDTLASHQFLMSYGGDGTFVCVTESGWRPDPELLMDDVNLALSRMEMFNNAGEPLEPRVSTGDAVRMIWKSGNAVMDALGEAHSSAKDAAIKYERNRHDFWLTEPQRA